MFELLDQFLAYARSLPIDLVNGTFEIVGALICSTNIARIRRDKHVEGFNPATQAFFAVWGLWNLIYYPALGQTWSFWGGVALVSVNITWLIHVAYYAAKRRKRERIIKKHKNKKAYKLHSGVMEVSDVELTEEDLARIYDKGNKD